jgi:uncharacterized membrane protein YdjX (TVP38/TMEM64 family)
MRFDLKSLARAAGLALPIVGGILLGRMVSPWLPGFATWVHSLGFWGPVVFVAAYVAVVVLMLPAFLLIMAGGAVFGVTEGSVLSLVGALLGGTAAFLIGRHYARATVERRVKAHPTLSALDRVIGEDGLKLVFLLRLSPAVPYVLTNYALGITRVRLRDFFIGTFGLIPIVVTYAAYGSASGTTTSTDGSAAVSPMMFAAGIAITVLLGLLLAKMVQKALREAELARLEQL